MWQMDQLEEIKSKIDIVPLISEHVQLKKTGRNLKALCPFHSEKTPSFIVSPERQMFHCFGCGVGGDVFGFVMQIEHVEFGEALRMLAKRAGVTLRRRDGFQESRQNEVLYEMNHLASEFFHYVLMKTSVGTKAREYVKKRHLSEESAKQFGIGYAPNSWDTLQRFLRKKGYKPEDMEKAGLVVKRERKPGYYDRFRGRVIFTLRDHRGNVIGFAGRILSTGEPKYINSPETPIYKKSDVLYGLDVTKEHVKKEDRVVVVEGEIDLISSYQAGVQNIVAIKGSALTPAHLRLLKRFTTTIALALDSDIAGDAAARRGIELAEQEGFDISVVTLKEGKDPDDCIQKDPNLWKEAVNVAVPFLDFLIDSAQKRFSLDTPSGKKKIAQEVLPALAAVSNEIVRSHYVKKLAHVLDVSEESVLSSLESIVRSKKEETREVNVSVLQKSREEVLEEYLIALLLRVERGGKEILENLPVKKIHTQALRSVWEELFAYWKTYKTFEINRFIKRVPKELVNRIDTLYLRNDIEYIVSRSEVFSTEIFRVANELVVIQLKRELAQLSEEIRLAESGTKTQELERLNRQFRDLSSRIERTLIRTEKK